MKSCVRPQILEQARNLICPPNETRQHANCKALSFLGLNSRCDAVGCILSVVVAMVVVAILVVVVVVVAASAVTVT